MIFRAKYSEISIDDRLRWNRDSPDKSRRDKLENVGRNLQFAILRSFYILGIYYKNRTRSRDDLYD